MSRRSVRQGITWVEVLVIVLLVGLLLFVLVPPALQSSREAARRRQCGDNLRSIVQGLQSYHDAQKVFPAGAMHAGPNPGGEPPVTAALGPSWWFGIMPFMDQQGPHYEDQKGVYQKIVESQRPGQDARYEFCADDINRYLTAHPYPHPRLAARLRARRSRREKWAWPLAYLVPPYMCCPSSPLPVTETVMGPIALPTYVGIAGGCDIDPRSYDYQTVGGAPSSPVAPEIEHIYHNKYKGTGAAAGGIVTSSGLLPPCQHVVVEACTDGASNTMIVAEQSDWLRERDSDSSRKYNGSAGWTDSGGNYISRGATSAGGGWLSGTRRVDPVPRVSTPGGPPAMWGGDCWNVTTVRYPPNLKRVMGNERRRTSPLPGCSENHGINNPLQSPHPGGLMVGMADGSVQFIQQTADLGVLLRLSIRDDGVSLRN